LRLSDIGGVTFTPEAHWNVAMDLRRQALAASDEDVRQELDRLARVAPVLRPHRSQTAAERTGPVITSCPRNRQISTSRH
jgi:hypothetical protein